MQLLWSNFTQDINSCMKYNNQFLGKNDCTNDKSCLGVAQYLAAYGVERSCADGTEPFANNGTWMCADNSTYGCHNLSLPIPAGLPRTAFPDNMMVFCYFNG